MKLRNSFVTAGFAALALAGASVLGSAGSAQAFGLSFTPAGSNFPDGDSIRDQACVAGSSVCAPGGNITFDVLFNTGNLDENDLITEIVFDFGYDSDELIPPPAIMPNPSDDGVATTTKHQTKLKYSGLSIAGTASGIAPKSVKFASLTFEVASLVDLNSDGKRDFFTTLKSVKGSSFGGPVVPFFNSKVGLSDTNDLDIFENKVDVYKQVEIQGATAVPTPALLPGLAAFGMSLVRKRKQEQAA
jgi:hypothetical protein